MSDLTTGRHTGAEAGGPHARGTVFVVATPIGNLSDLSERARQTLAAADVIAAEDTRHTAQLLQHCGISRPLVSLHEHNEGERVAELLARLHAGAQVVLVSDAGTPLLSDPGFQLVREAARAGISVRCIPGPSAITAALAVAGLPVQRFCFEGFLPARAGERRARLQALATETRTLVFFEAPHRIVASLTELAKLLGGNRAAVVARELTKVHESVYRGTLDELVVAAEADTNFARGEITLVVQGAPPGGGQGDQQLLHRAVSLLLDEMPPGRVAALAAQLSGASREEAYALVQAARGK
ncbi:MAG: 16S rRNA (cytidine(1402)-2'-O)-methyltransferase [Sinobacteraceae bacterium]|nr:16S rRNA (cytidine(1402)-2'-O)-methyltransferase [Nevskiaceae bacterium]